MAAKMTKPEIINQQVGWCPGCGHGIIQRLIAECCEELGLCEKTIQVVDIACAYWSIDTLNCDGIAGPHGRCAAVATAIKKVYPDSNVYVHAGDGCSYVMCPATTLVGDKTVSSKKGRDDKVAGEPFDMLNILQNYKIAYAARGSLCDPKHIDQTKKMLKKGFENQRDKKGFSIIEILSPCPTNWKLSPADAMKKMKEENEKVFPVKVYVDNGGDE